MRRGFLAGVLGFLCVASVAVAATSSATKGQVGGPPTLKLGPEDEGKKTTPPIVIGRGPTYGGHAEIVAYGWKPPPGGGQDGKKHFCIWVEYPSTDDIQFGTCAEAGQPESDVEISSETQQISPKSARYTEVGGLASSDVATVRVTYRRAGKTKHAKVTLATVTPDLQAKLDLPEGFGYWDTKVKGLVPFKSYKAKGFDSQGKLLATATHLTGETTFAR
jgi:hypothetical protein